MQSVVSALCFFKQLVNNYVTYPLYCRAVIFIVCCFDIALGGGHVHIDTSLSPGFRFASECYERIEQPYFTTSLIILLIVHP